MQKIIDPVSVELLLSELTPDKKLGDTNKGGNEIYVVDAHNAPNVLREIGRLREIAFRHDGGGTGLDCDLDEFDTMEVPYKQIVLWDPEAKNIIGGYRYICGNEIKFTQDGQPVLATSHMFKFSDTFIKQYLPKTLELGRAFVALDFQSSKDNAKAIWALDNLWDGIGMVMISNPRMKYLIGKVTVPPGYDRSSLDLLRRFFYKHFNDMDKLIRPINPVFYDADPRLLDIILQDDDFDRSYRALKNAMKKLGSFIPPLFNSYMKICPTLRYFGDAVNEEMSGVIETAIMVPVDDMYPDKVERHLTPFKKILNKFKK